MTEKIYSCEKQPEIGDAVLSYLHDCELGYKRDLGGILNNIPGKTTTDRLKYLKEHVAMCSKCKERYSEITGLDYELIKKALEEEEKEALNDFEVSWKEIKKRLKQ